MSAADVLLHPRIYIRTVFYSESKWFTLDAMLFAQSVNCRRKKHQAGDRFVRFSRCNKLDKWQEKEVKLLSKREQKKTCWNLREKNNAKFLFMALKFNDIMAQTWFPYEREKLGKFMQGRQSTRNDESERKKRKKRIKNLWCAKGRKESRWEIAWAEVCFMV